jgi:hypothetical protein
MQVENYNKGLTKEIQSRPNENFILMALIFFFVRKTILICSSKKAFKPNKRPGQDNLMTGHRVTR